MKNKYKNLIILVMLVVSSVIYGQVKAEAFIVEHQSVYSLPHSVFFIENNLTKLLSEIN